MSAHRCTITCVIALSNHREDRFFLLPFCWIDISYVHTETFTLRHRTDSHAWTTDTAPTDACEYFQAWTQSDLLWHDEVDIRRAAATTKPAWSVFRRHLCCPRRTHRPRSHQPDEASAVGRVSSKGSSAISVRPCIYGFWFEVRWSKWHISHAWWVGQMRGH